MFIKTLRSIFFEADRGECGEAAGVVAEAVTYRGRTQGICRLALFWAVGPTGTSEKNRHLSVTTHCCNAGTIKLGKARRTLEP